MRKYMESSEREKIIKNSFENKKDTWVYYGL